MHIFVSLPRLLRSLLFFGALLAVVCTGLAQPAQVARADPASQNTAPAGASVVYLPLLMTQGQQGGGGQPAPPPGALVGGWSWGGVSSSIDFYNPNTGQFAAPSGAGGYYRLKADGSFEEAALLVSSLYNCTMRLFFYQTGTYSVQGNAISLAPAPGGVQRSEDTCHAEFNYEQPYAKPGTYGWQLTRDERGVDLLLLTDENGERYGYTRDGPMAPPQPPGAPTTPQQPARSLVGVWRQGGVVSAASVYNHATKVWTEPADEGQGISFYDDGTYEFASFRVDAEDSCKVVYRYEAGEYSVAETSVTLRSWGRLMHEGTRCGDLYWDLADAPGPLSYEWRIDADAGGAATLTFSGLSALLTEAPFARAE